MISIELSLILFLTLPMIYLTIRLVSEYIHVSNEYYKSEKIKNDYLEECDKNEEFRNDYSKEKK